MEKKIFASVAVFFFIMGFSLSYLLMSGAGDSIGLNVSGENTYEAGWEAAKQRLKETGFVFGDEEMGIRKVNGIVEKIENDKLYVKINPLGPLADPDLDNRIVEVDSETKLYLCEMKDWDIYMQEEDAYRKQMDARMNSSEGEFEEIDAPEMYTKVEISLADLEVGVRIRVEAGEDIKEEKQFVAVKIEIEEDDILE